MRIDQLWAGLACILLLACGDSFLTGDPGEGGGGASSAGGSTTSSSTSSTTGSGGEGNGGSGGMAIAQGGGGSTGGTGGEGGSVPMPVYRLVWSPPDHPTGKYLGIVVNGQVFPDCVASSTSDETVECQLGAEWEGVTLQLALNYYNDPDGASFSGYGCDQTGYPSSDCRGIVELFKENVLIDVFQDDNVAATPPPAPWYYVIINNQLELGYPALP